MIRKTISMPDAMGKYIDKRVKAGQYGNDSEYIRDLIRKDPDGPRRHCRPSRQSMKAWRARVWK